MTTDNWAEIVDMHASKGDLFADLCETFDYALPQRWLNDMTDFCEAEGNEVTYDMIRSTTVWVYGKTETGPRSCCTEVANAIIAFNDYLQGIHPRKRPKRDPQTAE